MAADETLILVSNDDGITSSGISALARAMAPLGKVYVVAPDRERSAAGHSISLATPLRATEIAPNWFAVDGTPTDCVYLGIHHFLPRKPDLVVSGINHGANLGNDVTYSGTVSAAMEGAMFAVPSIAFSQHGHHALQGDFSVPAAHATVIARLVLARGLPPDTLLNVNFPTALRSDTERVWAALGRRNYGQQVDVRDDPRGRKYYWIGGDEIGHDDLPGSDCNVVAAGQIAVSPVHLDLTHRAALEALRASWAL